MERFITEQIETQVREVFQKLTHPVRILYFSQADHCEYCAETRQLLEEVASLSDLLSLEVFDLDGDAGVAAYYKIGQAPGFTLVGLEGEQVIDYGIRFFGLPYGNEFASFINTIVLVSTRKTFLSEATRDFLKKLDKKVNLQVFSTPT